MAENNFTNVVGSMMKGMEGFLSSKTVVGEPINVGNDTTIIPLVDVSFGMGAGAVSQEVKKNGAGGGMSGKLSPSAVLVVKHDQIRLVNVKNQDSMTKVLDMVPDLIDKFTASKDKEPSDEEAINTAFPETGVME